MNERLNQPIDNPVELSAEDKKQLTIFPYSPYSGFIKYEIKFKGVYIDDLDIDMHDVEGNLVPVSWVVIEDTLQGIGIGKEIYRKVNADLRAQGLRLCSDKSGLSSIEAQRVWRSLVRSGEVEYLDDTRYQFKG